jgi:hypothetical protein
MEQWDWLQRLKYIALDLRLLYIILLLALAQITSLAESLFRAITGR